MKEIWKDIEGYEGIYKVSNLGRVRSLDRKIVRNGAQTQLNGEVRKLSIQGGGYQVVNLSFNEIQSQHLVHRLVAKAFIANPENKPEVNHLDEVKTNNKASNLEWSTPTENVRYSIAIPIYQYTKDYELVREWGCGYDAEKEIKGFCSSAISKASKSELEITHGGFLWSRTKYSEADLGLIKALKLQSATTIYQYNSQLNLVKVWQDMNELDKHNFKLSLVRRSANSPDQLKAHKGFIFSYLELTEVKKNELLNEKAKRTMARGRATSTAKLKSHPMAKKVKHIDTGKVYPSLQRATEKLGLNYNTEYSKLRYNRQSQLRYVA